jgi:hypothetical protein
MGYAEKTRVGCKSATTQGRPLVSFFHQGQTLMRSASTVSLFLFPVLAAARCTKVFWIIAIAPLTLLPVLLAIRWEPSGYDIDAEDYEEPLAASGKAVSVLAKRPACAQLGAPCRRRQPDRASSPVTLWIGALAL